MARWRILIPDWSTLIPFEPTTKMIAHQFFTRLIPAESNVVVRLTEGGGRFGVEEATASSLQPYAERWDGDAPIGTCAWRT